MDPKEVELKHPFKYHYNGGEEDAKWITISAFTMKQLDKVAPVKEIAMKAMGKLVDNIDISAEDIEEAKQAKKEAKEDAENMDSQGLITVIAMNCGEGDLAKFYEHMKKLLTCGVAYINGSDVKLSGNYINDLNPSDFENLCGEYIGNFITS